MTRHTLPANRLAALLLLLLMLLSACGAPAAQPLRFGAAPWVSGETSNYNLIDSTDSSGSPVGTATLAIVQQAVDGAPGWVLRRQVAGAAGSEVSSVTMSSGYRPLRTQIVLTDAAGTEQVSAAYDQGQVDLELTTKANNTTVQKASVPSDARDQRSLWMLLRTLPLADGYATELNSYLPLTGRLERMTVNVEKQEQVTTPAGLFDTWRVTLDNGERKVDLWYSTDREHTLVKVDDGAVVWELTSRGMATP